MAATISSKAVHEAYETYRALHKESPPWERLPSRQKIAFEASLAVVVHHVQGPTKGHRAS